MGKDTDIEWCDSTVNPTGFQCCGCELWNAKKRVKICYAGRMAERIGGDGAFDKPVVLKPGAMAKAALWSDLRGKERPEKPWLNGHARVIFVGDMADTLNPAIEFPYLYNEIVQVTRSDAGRRHIFMWLTKQATRLRHFGEYLQSMQCQWPVNLWPGVSVTSAGTAGRIDQIAGMRLKSWFVSYEPAWEFVDFEPHPTPPLIIMGGESGGPSSRPFELEWARRTREYCDNTGSNFFLKQLGSRPVVSSGDRYKLTHPKGGDWHEWPDDLKVREFPECDPVPFPKQSSLL